MRLASLSAFAVLLGGCSFIDDFSRFEIVDAGTVPGRDGGGPGTDGFVPGIDAGPGVDSGTPGGPALTGVTDISVSYTHACAVRSGGELVCWGSNTCGELGLTLPSDASRTTRPVVVLASDVLDVEAGRDFTCALRGGGEVWCWGWNVNGMLGDGTTDDHRTPLPVTGITGATDVIVGEDTSCAIMPGGGVKCWGGDPLGNGSSSSSSVPVDVGGGLTGVTRFAVSWNHACAVDGSNRVRCWGADVYGELGTNDGSRDAPGTAVTLAGTATDVATGTDHTCALHGTTVSCWGSNEARQLARTAPAMEPLPVEVMLDEGAVRLIEGHGYDHMCAIGESGRLWCWGATDVLGAGPMDVPTRADPVEAIGLTDVVQVSAGPFAACARTGDGRAFCWGLNDWGVLGDGTQTDRFVPAPVLAVE